MSAATAIGTEERAFPGNDDPLLDRPRIRVSIAGASGYSGVELLRLLLEHPQVEIRRLLAGRQAGEQLCAVFPGLRDVIDGSFGETDWQAVSSESDVVFLALPHGHALGAAPTLLEAGCKVIDLGADFRLRDAASYERHYGLAHEDPELLERAVYGLAELHRQEIRQAQLVANPGCYPTATALALLPITEMLGSSIAQTIVVDAKSGVSGAGRQPSMGVHYSEVNENLKPYGVLGHRHQPEIEQTLSEIARSSIRTAFVPHLVPMTRGILSTCYVSLVGCGGLPMESEELEARYRDRYADEPFVRVVTAPELPQTKATYGSNYCDVAVRVDRERELVVAIGAIDNLGKGAAGQAVQNFNLMCGFDEAVGLPKAPVFP